MLSGPTCNAAEIAGTAVFRIVVSSDSMKNETATSHGKSLLAASVGEDGEITVLAEPDDVITPSDHAAKKIEKPASPARPQSHHFQSASFSFSNLCSLISHSLRPIFAYNQDHGWGSAGASTRADAQDRPCGHGRLLRLRGAA